jgi:hypothetical protein
MPKKLEGGSKSRGGNVNRRFSLPPPPTDKRRVGGKKFKSIKRSASPALFVSCPAFYYPIKKGRKIIRFTERETFLSAYQLFYSPVTSPHFISTFCRFFCGKKKKINCPLDIRPLKKTILIQINRSLSLSMFSTL